MTEQIESAKAKVTITRPVRGNTEILTREALSFIASLELRYGPQRRRLLAARKEWQAKFEAGKHRKFQYVKDAPDLRHAHQDTHDICIELLTTISAKPMERAKLSSVDRVIADFEDATAPRFDHMLEGQQSLLRYYGKSEQADPVSKDTSENSSEDASESAEAVVSNTPADKSSVKSAPELAIRARGLHMEEAHLQVNNAPLSAAFFDVGLYLFHWSETAKDQDNAGKNTPFVYLPKLEHPAEAKLWADIFRYSETRLGLEAGTIRAGIYVETLAGLLQLEGLVVELADYIAGLTTGKWDFVVSWAYAMLHAEGFILPDRDLIDDSNAVMQAYAAHILRVGVKYGLPVTGGVCNISPDDKKNLETPISTILAPRIAEAKAGFSGASVAFGELAGILRNVFQETPKATTKPKVPKLGVLFEPLEGIMSVKCAEANLALFARYAGQWLAGSGSPVLDGKMVYLAAAEIARVQIWIWLSDEVALATTEGGEGEAVTCNKAWLESTLTAVQAEYTLEDSVISCVRECLTAETLAESFAVFAYDTLKTS